MLSSMIQTNFIAKYGFTYQANNLAALLVEYNAYSRPFKIQNVI